MVVTYLCSKFHADCETFPKFDVETLARITNNSISPIFQFTHLDNFLDTVFQTSLTSRINIEKKGKTHYERFSSRLTDGSCRSVAENMSASRTAVDHPSS